MAVTNVEVVCKPAVERQFDAGIQLESLRLQSGVFRHTLIQYPSGTSFSFSAIVQSSFSILRVILRTGDLSKFLYHMMQHLRQFGICGFIIHFLSIPAADDQAAAL